MRPSRGMGAINPSKMPGKRVIKRKDNPDDVDMYSEGGDVKFNLGSLSYDKGNAGASGTLSIEKKISQLMPDAPKSVRDAVITAYLSGNIDLNKQGMKATPSSGGIGISLPFAEGGHVNEAGNYTKPSLRKRIVSQVKAAATQGTGAGQWSARKAQLVAKKYKAAGGGYRD
jgi:hypothetical protein